MATTDKKPSAAEVSDPSSPDYDPHSPYYEITADPSSKYYVGPINQDDVLSGDDIRAEANQTVDVESLTLGWLGLNLPPAAKEYLAQRMYERKLEESRKGLQDGLELRDPGAPPHTQWDNATHEQMVQAITEDADSATVAESSEEWVRVGNELAAHQQNLADAINASTANWQGGGGDAAREHLANVGKWLGTTAQGATLSGRQQEIHSQTLNETQKAMEANPPVKFSVQEANAQLQQTKDPIEYAAQAAQVVNSYREQQAARGQAAQIMTRFDSTIGSAVTTPQFAPPPKLKSASGGGSGSGGGAGGGGGAPGSRPGSGTDQTFGSQSLPGGGDGSNGGPGGGGPGGSGPGGVGTSSFDPNSVGTPGGGPGGGGSGPGGAGFNPGSVNLPGGGGTGGNGPGGSNFNPGSVDLPGGGGTGGNGPGGSNFNPGSINLPGGGPGDGTTTSGYQPPSANLPNSTGPGGSPFNPGSINLPGGTGGNGPTSTPPKFDPGSINLPGGGPLGGPGNTGPGGTGPGGTGKIPTIGRTGGVNGDSISSRLGGGGGGGGSVGGGSLGGGAGGGAGGKGGSLGGGSATGAGGPGTPEEQAAGRGGGAGAGTKGAAGSPGMGGMGAAGKGGGKGQEDKEHKIADFVESDDPSFFSADEVVAPPVIGDWKNTDWK
ncbi:hypothetical protein [Amycolatopsis ultiminotia]|uniref:hypothetical protein n=1 Tax=Amycolatopsis ultiminotia TaxID=543629 RepID=UPI0031E9940B